MPPSKYWYKLIRTPITLPTYPIDFLNPNFDFLFIRTRVCEDIDNFIENIERQYGIFWISSKRGGLGKSTLLSYITRKLFLSFDKLRALPFLINLESSYGSIEQRFYRVFLESLLKLGDTLIEVKNVLNTSFPTDFEDIVLEDFRKNRKRIEELLDELPSLSLGELDRKFHKALDSVLKKWYSKDRIIKKFVLLVDEMDKLETNEVLSFLGKSQKMFEYLYVEYGFVVFFAGHKPWVERIHEGTEYSFYKGKIFEIFPFHDIEDIKRLIITRLTIHANFERHEIPFQDEAYERIRDLTGGCPREILNLVSEIINEAARRGLPAVGPGFVDEVNNIMCSSKVEELLNPSTYEKLRSMVGKKLLYDIINIIYDYSVKHEIPKEYDKNFDARVKDLGLEVSDKEWQTAIETLLRLECIIDKKASWALSKDIIELFDGLSKQNISRSHLLSIISKFKLSPKSEKIAEPDFDVALDRPFNVNPNKWYTKKEIFNWFKDSTSISMYVRDKYPNVPYEKKVREIFEAKFKSYLKKRKNRGEILVFQKFYRKSPKGLDKDTFELLKKLNSLEIINNFIRLIIEPELYDSKTIKDIDSFIENLLIKLGELKGIKIKKEFLRKKILRYKTFKMLELTEDLKRRLNFYIGETEQKISYDSELIKNTLHKTISLLLKNIIKEQKNIENMQKHKAIHIKPDKPYTNIKRIEDWLSGLYGDILILDKHFDKVGLDLLSGIDFKKGSKIRILIGHEKLSSSLRRRIFAFIDEMKNKGIAVQVRVLNKDDASKIHDRYIMNHPRCIFNIPPLNIIHKKLGDILPIDPRSEQYDNIREDLEKYWKRATKIENI